MRFSDFLHRTTFWGAGRDVGNGALAPISLMRWLRPREGKRLHVGLRATFHFSPEPGSFRLLPQLHKFPSFSSSYLKHSAHPRMDARTCQEELSLSWMEGHTTSLPVSSRHPFSPKPQAYPLLYQGDCGKVADDRPLDKLNLPPTPSPMPVAGEFGSLNSLGLTRHNNQEQSGPEENPAEKSGKVKTGARCLSRGKLIVFLGTEQLAVSLKIIIDTCPAFRRLLKKKKCGEIDWKHFFSPNT